jgi:hypothetical protein
LDYFVSLPKNYKTINFKNMMFNEQIKELREKQWLPVRKLTVALDIDTASYCKIEKGERRARKEYIPVIAEFLKADKDEPLTFLVRGCLQKAYTILGIKFKKR